MRLKLAAFPYERRLEEVDCSAVPALPKTRLLELAQGAFLTKWENLWFIGASGLEKTHLLLAVGRALCLAGHRGLFRMAAMLTNELEGAHKELRLPPRLAHYRRFEWVRVDEVGYPPFSQQVGELLFPFFSDRPERTSVVITSNLAFAQWAEVFGSERMTAALLDRLVHHSHILIVEGERFRFRQSLQWQTEAKAQKPTT